MILAFCLTVACRSPTTPEAISKSTSLETASPKEERARALSSNEQWRLGQAYQYGRDQRLKNHAQAAAIFRQIMDIGPTHPYFTESHLVLGWMSLYGLGMPQAEDAAATHFEIAANAGHPEAMVELAWLLELGFAGTKDPTAAMIWLQKAARAGLPQAVWLLSHWSRHPAKAHVSNHPKFREPLTQARFARIEPGSFRRHPLYPASQEMPVEFPHMVTISQAFHLGLHEITQSQWLQIMGTPELYDLGDDENLPIVGINWYQAQAFVHRLNRLSPYAGFRLPTEAEWEWACRAGTETLFHSGDTLDPTQANVDFRYAEVPFDSYIGKPKPVGSYPPNNWGLFDMHGNVLEWCQDDGCAFDPKKNIDPLGICGSDTKVIRGGSWYFDPSIARSSYRDFHRPQDLGKSLGLRIAKTIYVK